MYIGTILKNFNNLKKIVTFGRELLQFTYAVIPNFSIIEQILDTFGVNRYFMNFVTKSSNLASSTPPFTIKSRPKGLFFYCQIVERIRGENSLQVV